MPNCPPCPRCFSNMTYLDNNISYACTKCGERWDIIPKNKIPFERTLQSFKKNAVLVKNKITPTIITRERKIDKEILTKLFYDGMAYAEIAEYFKVSVMAVTQIVFKNKLKRTKKKRNDDWHVIDTIEFKKLVREEKTTVEIARKMNFSVAAIREAKKNIKVRK